MSVGYSCVRPVEISFSHWEKEASGCVDFQAERLGPSLYSPPASAILTPENIPNILTCEWVHIFHRQTQGLTGMLISWCKHAAHCIDIIIYYLFVKSRKKYQSLNCWGKYFGICSLPKTIFLWICDSDKCNPELFLKSTKKSYCFDQKMCSQKIGSLKWVEWWWGFEVSTF